MSNKESDFISNVTSSTTIIRPPTILKEHPQLLPWSPQAFEATLHMFLGSHELKQNVDGSLEAENLLSTFNDFIGSWITELIGSPYTKVNGLFAVS